MRLWLGTCLTTFLLCMCSLTASTALSFPVQPIEETFRLNNIEGHGDKGLTIVEFVSWHLPRSGRTTLIQPENVFESQELDHADLVVELSLSCDPLPELETTERVAFSRTLYIERGHEGLGRIRVKGDKFHVTSPAFMSPTPGSPHEGKLTFSGRFSKSGTKAAGAISADLPSVKLPAEPVQGIQAETLTNCETDPGGVPSKLGKPLKFRVAGSV